jgi:hypothetical protein
LVHIKSRIHTAEEGDMNRIQSNVKGHIDIKLQAPYVLLHGRNGGGKSAVVHSVELACFGEVRDAAGRDMKAKHHVEHVARPGEELSSHVGFEGGLSFTWPSKKNYGMVNPLAIATDVMTAGTDKMLVYLLENMDEDHPVKLDYANWDAVVKSHGSYRKGLTQMHAMCSKSLRSFQAKVRDHKTVQKWASATGDMVVFRSVQILLEEDQTSLAQQKELLSQVKKEMASFVKGALPALEEKMLRYMPDEMDAPKFCWVGNDLRLGFEGRPVPSGAESVALAIALAAVTVPDESDSRHVWILPDRAYDPKTLGNLMRVLRGLFCRAVVVQSTVLPEGYDYMGTGWDLVEV